MKMNCGTPLYMKGRHVFTHTPQPNGSKGCNLSTPTPSYSKGIQSLAVRRLFLVFLFTLSSSTECLPNSMNKRLANEGRSSQIHWSLGKDQTFPDVHCRIEVTIQKVLTCSVAGGTAP